MAAIRNPHPFSLFSVALHRSIGAGEVIDGLSDEEADAACRSGTFERGYTAIAPDTGWTAPEEAADPTSIVTEDSDSSTASEDATPGDDEKDVTRTEDAEAADEEKPKRPAGRRTSKRGAASVEETSEDEDEIETR